MEEEGRNYLKAVYHKNAEGEQSEEETFRLMNDDQYHKSHPNHTLGEAYDTTDSFGKQVVGYRGNLASVLEKARLDLGDFQADEPEVLETVIEPSVEEMLQEKKGVENVKKVLKERIDRKAKQKVSFETDYELYSFDEIIKRYNSEISEEEIKAWIWYKRSRGLIINDSQIVAQSNNWSKYVIPLQGAEEYLQQWLEKGILSFYKGNYYPTVLYYSENIYEKQLQLQKEKKDIVERFGEEQYKRQEEGLKSALPKPLQLKGENSDEQLIIKPNSDFAEQYKIQEFRDGTNIHEKVHVMNRSQDALYSLRQAYEVWLKQIPHSEFEISNRYDIKIYYLGRANAPRNVDHDEFLRAKQNAKAEGDRLFQQFLYEGITEEDRRAIESKWNSQFNGYVPINYFKIPIAFQCSSTFKNKPLFIRPAQREGLGFLAVHGGGCIAYDVGVGKTMTGILSIAHAMESGMCKRPLIVVPNQTYKNWLGEIRGILSKKGELLASGILPQYPVNDLYNLSEKHIASLLDEEGEVELLPENSISVITYEGLRKLAFTDFTWNEIKGRLFQILNQGIESSRESTALEGKIEELMGKGSIGSNIEIEKLGFDYLLMDEAHISKKIFTQVKGEVNESGERERSDYKIASGTPSAIALKSFMVAQYVQKTSNNNNVVLLTATPFTNSPLEIFSMLSLIAYHRLEKLQLDNLQQFFNHFIQSSIELIISAQLVPQRKEIIMGFNNLIALQQLIFQFIDYKSGEEAEIHRPNKIVLPMKNQKVDGVVVPLPAEEQISTTTTPTTEQQLLMAQLESYLLGKTELEGILDKKEKPTEEETDAEKLKDKRNDPARILKGITLGRQIAFSPYLIPRAENVAEKVNYLDFIQSSPKLMYTMGCIQSVKKHCENIGEPMSGQLIYSNAGTNFFPHIKEYLVKELGFDPKEVDFIKGGMTARKKELVKDKFLSGVIKVVIGSQTIREGINLQNRATDLYNLWLDWNPTDLYQLEGRIWRFGNQFANVRIVIPLVEDSVDVAIFQKLEEKSSRINYLWQRSGKENTLKLENFNPSELKTSLISNPKRLAEVMILEKKEILKDEVNGLLNQRDELNNIVETRETYRKFIGEIEKTVANYRPLKKNQPPRKMPTIFKIYQEYLDDPETQTTYNETYGFTEARWTYYRLEKIERRFLRPRGLDMNFKKEELLGSLEEEVKLKELAMEAETNERAKRKLIDESIAERKRKNIKKRTIAERVEELA